MFFSWVFVLKQIQVEGPNTSLEVALMFLFGSNPQEVPGPL